MVQSSTVASVLVADKYKSERRTRVMLTNVIDRNNEEIIWKIERTIVLITLSKELRSGNVKYQAFERLGTLQNEQSSIQNDL